MHIAAGTLPALTSLLSWVFTAMEASVPQLCVTLSWGLQSRNTLPSIPCFPLSSWRKLPWPHNSYVLHVCKTSIM